MMEHIDAVTIGAGQSELAISYCLTQLGHRHIILEKASSITLAWRNRWDSFTLVLPNWTLLIPGCTYQGDNL